jgi:hypothetical protein
MAIAIILYKYTYSDFLRTMMYKRFKQYVLVQKVRQKTRIISK